MQRFTPAEVVAGIRWGPDMGEREEPSGHVILTPCPPGLPVLMMSSLHEEFSQLLTAAQKARFLK